MGRQVREKRLESREARKGLAATREPYWRLIEPGLHLGYAKGERAAVWFARYRLNGRYWKKSLGIADDFSDANGFEVLNFAQAQEQVRRFRAQCVQDAAPGRAPMTVATVVDRYMEWFTVERKAVAITRRSFDAHIVPVFGPKLVSELTKADIQRWRDRLVKEPPRKRTRVGRKQAYREVRTDPEGKRARKATVNRLLANLKAALNFARREGLVTCVPVWADVPPFRNATSARIRFLTKDEAHRLVAKCPEDFRPLVQAALYTGARYKELISAAVNDYSAEGETVLLRETKNSKPRHAFLTVQGKAFFDSITANRAGSEPLFVRGDGERWGNAQQTRRMVEASAAAEITPHVTFHVLRHTYGAGLAMAGVPLQVMAQALGHSDTRITEKHYAHLMPSYVATTIRANLPDFGGYQSAKVVPITAAQRRSTTA